MELAREDCEVSSNVMTIGSGSPGTQGVQRTKSAAMHKADNKGIFFMF
jgi:hypothetical protein